MIPLGRSGDFQVENPTYFSPLRYYGSGIVSFLLVEGVGCACGWDLSVAKHMSCDWKVTHSSPSSNSNGFFYFFFHSLDPVAETPPKGYTAGTEDLGQATPPLVFPDLEQAPAFPFAHRQFSGGLGGPLQVSILFLP